MKYKRILILDDNETSVFLNSDVATDYFPGTEIMTFSDSAEFMNRALETKEWFSEPTLLMLDINMPKYFGYELLEELEEELEDLKKLEVIMVTSSNLRRDMERATRFDCILGYLEKPLTIDKLDSVLKGRK